MTSCCIKYEGMGSLKSGLPTGSGNADYCDQRYVTRAAVEVRRTGLVRSGEAMSLVDIIEGSHPHNMQNQKSQLLQGETSQHLFCPCCHRAGRSTLLITRGAAKDS